jgi:hypothetical protein
MRIRAVLFRALRLFSSAPLLLCCVSASAFAQNKPLVTRYIECMRDDKGRDIGSQTMRTPVFDSKRGFKVYGVVVASQTQQETCNNTSTIYLAEPAGTFRVAFQQTSEFLPDGGVYDGNGIEGIEWSPSGTRTLIQVSQWTWGSDFGWNTKYILLAAAEGIARELPLSAAIQRHFAQPCARLVNTKGWLDDGRISIEVMPVNDLDEEGIADQTASCVEQPTLFTFEVDSSDFR